VKKEDTVGGARHTSYVLVVQQLVFEHAPQYLPKIQPYIRCADKLGVKRRVLFVEEKRDDKGPCELPHFLTLLANNDTHTTTHHYSTERVQQRYI